MAATAMLMSGTVRGGVDIVSAFRAECASPKDGQVCGGGTRKRSKLLAFYARTTADDVRFVRSGTLRCLRSLPNTPAQGPWFMHCIRRG